MGSFLMMGLGFDELKNLEHASFEHAHSKYISLTTLDIGIQTRRNEHRNKGATLADLHTEEPVRALPAIKPVVDGAFDFVSVSMENPIKAAYFLNSGYSGDGRNRSISVRRSFVVGALGNP